MHLRKPQPRPDTQNQFPGLYRARVEFRADPYHTGRVKVRIPQLHGIPDVTKESVSIPALPWAIPGNSSGSGYDSGSFIVPPVGSFVWVEFEAGDPSKPVYHAGVHGTGSESEHVYGSLHDDWLDPDKVAAGRWSAPLGESEVPQDAYDGKTSHEPFRDVLHKSLKGHTIYTDDEDGKESLSFIDRAGQVLRFLSPIKRDVNRAGDASFKRGTRDAVKGDQFDYEEDSVGQKAVIFLKDLATQVVRMVAEFGKEKIDLISRNKADETRSVVHVASGDGDHVKVLILSEDDSTENQTYIKMNTNDGVMIESGVVVSGKYIPKSTMSKDGVLHQVWNEPYKIEVYTYAGGGKEVEFEDTEDEKAEWMEGE